jgi:hypothetical protein
MLANRISPHQLGIHLVVLRCPDSGTETVEKKDGFVLRVLCLVYVAHVVIGRAETDHSRTRITHKKLEFTTCVYNAKWPTPTIVVEENPGF